jgi:HNH endonuclease
MADSSDPRQCPKCKLVFATKQRLKYHVDHAVCEKPALVCVKCNKTFLKRYRYNDHVATCTHGDKPATVCGASASAAPDNASEVDGIVPFNKTAIEPVLSHIEGNTSTHDTLREAFENGCLHEELACLTHWTGPKETRNVISIDKKGPGIRVVGKGKVITTDASDCIAIIISRNIELSNSAVVRGVLGLLDDCEPVLEVATTPRQRIYESLQIRFVIDSGGEYMMRSRALVRKPVGDKASRIAWSIRTRNCVAAQQGWQCNICDEKLTSCFDIDHEVPLFKGGADAYSNLQALCVPCHRNKTAAERSKGVVLLPTDKDTASTSDVVE